jgi:hypothetical protein
MASRKLQEFYKRNKQVHDTDPHIETNDRYLKFHETYVGQILKQDYFDNQAQAEAMPLPAGIDKPYELYQRVQILIANKYKPAGSRSNLGEQLFRSFDSLGSYPSVRALSNEEYDKMLRNLSAGYSLSSKSTDEEISAAKEENKQGFATLRAVMSKHYDYLFRKYGNIVSTLDYDTFFEHYTEISMDINNAQVDSNLCENIDDFLDPDNPEDQLLRNRVAYYSLLAVYKGMMGDAGRGKPKTFLNEEVRRRFKNERGYEFEGKIGDNPTNQIRWHEPYNRG